MKGHLTWLFISMPLSLLGAFLLGTNMINSLLIFAIGIIFGVYSGNMGTEAYHNELMKKRTVK
jgi:hypothetical protein